jgi:tRNA uridine 5-carboxymethylaminomethyl modification enzyme
MSYATVYVSAIEGSEKTAESVKALNKSAAGYIRREQSAVDRRARLEDKRLSPDLDYLSLKGLRLEAAQKLDRIRPRTVGQASRISGVNPADITVLLIHLGLK